MDSPFRTHKGDFYICDTKIYKDMLTEEYEHCGIFVPDYTTTTSIGTCVNKKFENIGYKINNRGACKFLKESQLVWHTHPNCNKAYPSKEDVWKVLKNRIIKNSVIITSWGIWQLIYNDFLTNTEQFKPILNGKYCISNCDDYNFMNTVEKRMYEATNNGTALKITNNEQRRAIEYYKFNVERLYKGLKVHFTEWGHMYKDKYTI